MLVLQGLYSMYVCKRAHVHRAYVCMYARMHKCIHVQMHMYTNHSMHCQIVCKTDYARFAAYSVIIFSNFKTRYEFVTINNNEVFSINIDFP